MHEYLVDLFESHFPTYSLALFNLAVVTGIFLFAVIVHFILHRIVLKLFLNLSFIDRAGSWLSALNQQRFFHNAVLMIQFALVQIQIRAWLGETSSLRSFISSASDLALLFFGLMSVFGILNAFQKMINSKASKRRIPLKGILQTTKIILSLVVCLISSAILLGKSPILLLSGVGAFSAVMMLIFKDPIMGLVAGIQLSANNMLTVGDWLEMPNYSADGDVIDIGLTTVKVRNWDNTITTIPTYALISDSFKNWRGMSESGGRRIKRRILINTSSIKFLDGDDIEQLKKSNLLASYLHEKLETLEVENSKLGVDMSSTINGQRLTNVGTFRNYLNSYLKLHPNINQNMTLMVRQLESSKEGLPIEVYAFANTTKWIEYENIQADIFDHIFAVLPEFKLVVHESPVGNDIRQLSKR
jgi:miniconductance mechanosensitive channel